MRRVTLYDLKQTELMAYEGQDCVQRDVMERLPIFLPGDLLAEPIDSNVAVESVPVHMIRGCGRDRYIAIAPDLREILEAPFKEQVRQAKALSDELVRRIQSFHRMPWWKRILRALQRAL